MTTHTEHRIPRLTDVCPPFAAALAEYEAAILRNDTPGAEKAWLHVNAIVRAFGHGMDYGATLERESR